MSLKILDCDVVRHWLSNSLYCKLVTKSDGSIVWANRAFCNWIGYLQSEIINKKSSDFSPRGDSFEKDLDNLDIIKNDYVSSYAVHKRFIKRNGDSDWGIFHIMKCPEINGQQNDFYLCSWHPIDGEQQDIVRQVLVKLDKLTQEIVQMAKNMTEFVEKSCTEPIDEESKWFSYTIKMIKKYPKTSMLIFVLVIGSFGVNNIIQILGELGIIELIPKKIVKP